MARVYAVVDPTTGRRRAVKLLTERGMAWTRFGREYRALARLNHPNIVQVYRYGVDEHRQAYLVMELLDGVPVQEWVARFGEPGAPSRSAAVVHAMTGLARALGYLHARGFIHRDLKSSNVLVLGDGTPKLLDFGATRSIGPDDSCITRLGEFVGTFTYASPEQIEGGQQDERSDIYSLGVLIYRLLCGRPPFDADSIAAVSRMHFEATPQRLSERVPGLPEGLSQLVHSMLSKGPEDRPQRATEVAEALTWLGEQALEAPTLGSAHEAAPPPLVGRRSALQGVQAALERARPGRLLLLLGGPGSGRDRMLAEAQAMSEAAGFEVWRAEPRDGVLSVVAPAGAEDLEGLFGVLESGGRPAVLLLRRLNRAGAAGIEALERFRAAIIERSLPVLMVASLPEVADSGAFRLAFLDAGRVPLRPLTRGEVAVLLEGMLGVGSTSRSTVQRIHQATGAQPGFVVRVVEAMIAKGMFVSERGPAGFRRWSDQAGGRVAVPEPVRRELARQLEALPEEDVRLLVATALAKDAAHPAVLARALAVESQALAVRIERLRRLGILAREPVDGPLGFAVKLFEPMLLEWSKRHGKDELVERLADALPAPRASLGAVALLVAAGRHEESQEELARCYLASRTGHDLAQHINLVGSVLERASRRMLSHPRVLVRLELGWARAVAALDMDDPRVDEALERASEQVIEPDSGAEVALERARIHGLRGEGPEQDQALELAERTLAGAGSASLQHHVLLARSGHALRSGALELAGQRAVGALVLATRARDPYGEGRARIAHAAALRSRGKLEQAEGQLSAAASCLERAGGHGSWLARLERAGLLRLEGRLSEALELLEEPLQRAQDQSDAPRILAMVPVMVEVELDLYRLGDARELLAELADMELDDRHPVAAAALSLARGRLLLASGAPGEAVELLSHAMAEADDAGLRVAARRLEASLGEALALSGDPRLGAAASDRAVEDLASLGHLPALAEACACRMRGQGERIDPAWCFGPTMPWLQEQPLRLHRLEFLLASAEQAAARGDSRTAHWAYQDAQALLEEIAGLLSDELRAAFRVHPWFRRVRRGESLGAAWKGRR
jgi:tetratricopeptide (TPR) repeat protein